VLLLVLVVAVAATFALTGRTDDDIHVTARFDDVGDLAPRAPVMLADIRVGTVDRIELDGTQALVSMSIDPDADVPSGVIARVRRTSLLGERVIDLVVPDGLAGSAAPLKAGDEIADTEVRPDLENLIAEGNDVLAPIAASEIATLVDEGATAFGDRGEELGALLNNFSQIVGAYAGETGTIRDVIVSLNTLNSTLARQTDSHRLALRNTLKSIRMLREESDELDVAIQSLTRLSIGGRGILEAHSDEMSNFFRQMRTILGVLREQQASIEGLLQYAPKHNRNTQLVEYTQFNLVLQDFVICGLNDDPSDPARTCEPNTGFEG
jgi:phospholipid/cholesterol/gamma-HCH transport system substrate-binding protein